MKYIFILLIILLYKFTCTAQVLFEPKAKALHVVSLFQQQKYNAVYELMDDTLKRIIDAEQLEGIWDGLIMKFDTLYSVGEPVITDLDSFKISITPLHFKKLKLGLKLTFNKKEQISGIFIVPLTYPYQPAAYVKTAAFYEIKKNVPDPKYPSEGILTLPMGNKKTPLIIIVGGSGPTDKDLTIGPNKIYKDFAWGLAAKGISVYRYNKRTVEFAKQFSANKNSTVNEEYLLDLKLIIKMLSKNERIDKHNIYVMGHSEGGYLLPYFAKNVSGIKSFISIAGNYSKLAVLVPQQLTYLAAHSDNEKKKTAILKLMPQAVYARDHFTKNTPDDSLPFGLSTAYLWHLNQNGPEELKGNLKKNPILLIQGGRDYQVPPSELEKWKQALAKNSMAAYKIYPSLNHLFLPGSMPSVPDEYSKPGNVPEEVINDIADWVLHDHTLHVLR